MRKATDPPSTRLFDGRYKIIRKLGSAGWRTSTSPRTRSSAGSVAIKILDDRHRPDSSSSSASAARRRTRQAVPAEHRLDLRPRRGGGDVLHRDGRYLDGRSLKELIVSRGPAPISIAID